MCGFRVLKIKKDDVSAMQGDKMKSFSLCHKKLFGDLIITLLSLRQFFKYLSRKAEGIGPMKPWQPLQVTHL